MELQRPLEAVIVTENGNYGIAIEHEDERRVFRIITPTENTAHLFANALAAYLLTPEGKQEVFALIQKGETLEEAAAAGEDAAGRD